MPVPLDEHDPDIDLEPGTTKSEIVVFLSQNPDLGYKPREIQSNLDIPRGTATTTLKRLYEEGYIGKTSDSYYHALSDRGDIRRYVANVDQVHRMFGHHREGNHGLPEEPQQNLENTVSDEELESELTELEDELEE